MAHTVGFGFETAGSLPSRPPAAAGPALSEIELRMLTSIVEVLAPGGGASCVESLDRRLRGPLSRFLPAYRQGLAAVDAACRQNTSSGLLDLEAGSRRMFVRQMRTGHKLTAFFSMLTCSVG